MVIEALASKNKPISETPKHSGSGNDIFEFINNSVSSVKEPIKIFPHKKEAIKGKERFDKNRKDAIELTDKLERLRYLTICLSYVVTMPIEDFELNPLNEGFKYLSEIVKKEFRELGKDIVDRIYEQ